VITMPTTEENPPLAVGGRFQWGNLPVYAKLLVGAIGIFVTGVVPLINYVRAQNAEAKAAIAEAADKRATQAKQAAEAGFQLTKEYVQGLEHRIAVLEMAAKRAQPERGRSPRRPIPVATPPRPAPLPRDLNTAEAQVFKGAPPAPAPRVIDGGA
jgi:hypothetical protein